MSGSAGSEISEDIIRGCASGDTKCQRLVYEIFYTRMYAICLRYSRDEDEALDLLHEGFIKVFKYAASFNGDADFAAWIKRVFTNNCIDYVRSAYKKYITYVDEVFSNESEEMDFKSDDTPEVEKSAVFAAMNKLRPDYRLVLNLYAVENLSHAEIADRLGIQEVSSRSKLLRARKALKKLLNSNG
ncbi:MAG: sigma-70 family RNA polymerase sigma factor [Bacteroidetes bacterium]|nr:sigma-70 family RNA polymerase sigma factor [Bacteroidota bacterium]